MRSFACGVGDGVVFEVIGGRESVRVEFGFERGRGRGDCGDRGGVDRGAGEEDFVGAFVAPFGVAGDEAVVVGAGGEAGELCFDRVLVFITRYRGGFGFAFGGLVVGGGKAVFEEAFGERDAGGVDFALQCGFGGAVDFGREGGRVGDDHGRAEDFDSAGEGGEIEVAGGLVDRQRALAFGFGADPAFINAGGAEDVDPRAVGFGFGSGFGDVEISARVGGGDGDRAAPERPGFGRRAVEDADESASGEFEAKDGSPFIRGGTGGREEQLAGIVVGRDAVGFAAAAAMAAGSAPICSR